MARTLAPTLTHACIDLCATVAHTSSQEARDERQCNQVRRWRGNNGYGSGGQSLSLSGRQQHRNSTGVEVVVVVVVVLKEVRMIGHDNDEKDTKTNLPKWK